MPSSYVDSVPPIVHLIARLAPSTVLDVGPGWGKYGLACREYLSEVRVVDAVEVAQGARPTQRCIYDAVHVADVRQLPSQWWQVRAYDLVLLIDVIEHMTLAEGHALLERMLAPGGHVLVSTPKQFFHQHDEDNPHEEHVSHWAWEDLHQYGVEADVSTIDSLIYLL